MSFMWYLGADISFRNVKIQAMERGEDITLIEQSHSKYTHIQIKASEQIKASDNISGNNICPDPKETLNKVM